MSSFIQFYETKPDPTGSKVMNLRNGFSSVGEVIKNRGDIIWVDPYQNYFPEVDNEVYISCGFEIEFIYIEEWVRKRPDIKFIVGGPAVSYMNFSIDLPNVYFDNRYMFELLNITPTSDMWSLKIPEAAKENKLYIYYTYPLTFGNSCYWGKCTICNRKTQLEIDLQIDKIPILKPNRNIVWLNKLSITAKDILIIFPTLSKESFYSFFIRGDSVVLDALNKIQIVDTLRPIIGVEFPSNRMLNLMNKGINIETLLKVIITLAQNGCLIKLCVIHGWPNLIEDDVKSVEYFLSKLEPFKKQVVCFNHWLFSHTKEDNTMPYKTKYDKLYYIYKLDKEQMKLNNKVLNLYKGFGFLSYSVSGIFEDFFHSGAEEYYKFIEKGQKII
jgi:hypothetical protein